VTKPGTPGRCPTPPGRHDPSRCDLRARPAVVRISSGGVAASSAVAVKATVAPAGRSTGSEMSPEPDGAAVPRPSSRTSQLSSESGAGPGARAAGGRRGSSLWGRASRPPGGWGVSPCHGRHHSKGDARRTVTPPSRPRLFSATGSGAGRRAARGGTGARGRVAGGWGLRRSLPAAGRAFARRCGRNHTHERLCGTDGGADPPAGLLRRVQHRDPWNRAASGAV